MVVAVGFLLPGTAWADDATVMVAGPLYATPPEPPGRAVDEGVIARDPELRRSSFRLALGPSGITTGKGVGAGVGIGADIGTGSVGGRVSATWLRGEGKSDGGSSSATGSGVAQYAGEITLDLHKSGPIHPVVGMGVAVLHVSRTDGKSGFGGVGTGRVAIEYALGLDDADVRLGASVTGGLVGPVDDDVKDLRAYVLPGVQVAIGF